MTARIRWLIIGLAVAGLAVSGAATYVHYKLITQPSYISPCDINAEFNCSDVYLSRFGSVRGKPVALGGVLFFAMVGLIAGFSQPRRRPAGDAGGAYIFALSTIGLAVSLYLGWASLFVLHKKCVLCIGTYVVVAVMFIVSAVARSMPLRRVPRQALADVSAAMRSGARVLAMAVFAGLAVWLVGWFPAEGAIGAASAPAASAPAPGTAAGTEEERFDRIWAQQPRVDLGIAADGAKVVIVKFNDWQCTACRASHYAYKDILERYRTSMPGTIKYVTKDYPLNPRCNANVFVRVHVAPCEAAAAVRLAGERGKRDAMIEWSFGHQDATGDVVAEHVKQDLGVTDFPAQYARVLPDIQRDIADGGALHVPVTPTFYINGVRALTPENHWLDPKYFDYAIRYELNQSRSSPSKK